MKTVLTSLLLLLLVSAGCHREVSPEQNDTADFNYTDDLGQAKKWFDGKWKLTAASSMNSNSIIEDVYLIVADDQITVIRDEKQIDKVNFEITKAPYSLRLKTTAQPRADNWYVRNPSLQVSRNRLFLDTGMVADLPAFGFERVK